MNYTSTVQVKQSIGHIQGHFRCYRFRKLYALCYGIKQITTLYWEKVFVNDTAQILYKKNLAGHSLLVTMTKLLTEALLGIKSPEKLIGQ